jgi:hypothetical protein
MKIPCVVVPAPEHCKNVRNADHSGEYLSDFIKLRHASMYTLVANRVANMKVLDTCCTTMVVHAAKTATRLANLRQARAKEKDGVPKNRTLSSGAAFAAVDRRRGNAYQSASTVCREMASPPVEGDMACTGSRTVTEDNGTVETVEMCSAECTSIN